MRQKEKIGRKTLRILEMQEEALQKDVNTNRTDDLRYCFTWMQVADQGRRDFI
jgi:hypothetical protein